MRGDGGGDRIGEIGESEVFTVLVGSRSLTWVSNGLEVLVHVLEGMWGFDGIRYPWWNRKRGIVSGGSLFAKRTVGNDRFVEMPRVNIWCGMVQKDFNFRISLPQNALLLTVSERCGIFFGSVEFNLFKIFSDFNSSEIRDFFKTHMNFNVVFIILSSFGILQPIFELFTF